MASLKHLFLATTLISCSSIKAQSYLELVDSADVHIRQEKWEQAHDDLLAALRKEPANSGNTLLFSNLGVVRTHLKDFGGALQAYEAGLARAPRSTVLLSNKAYTLVEAGRHEEAIEPLSKALETDSTLSGPRKMRGFILLRKGETKKAADDFIFLTENNPDNAEALFGLAQCLEATGDDSKALDLYAKSMRISPDESTGFSHVLLLIRMERLEEASTILREYIRVYPHDGNLYLLRAVIHKMNFENSRATEAKKIAISNGADPQLIERLMPGK